MSATDAGFLAALEHARAGAAEGGIPVGSANVSPTGEMIGKNPKQKSDF